MRSILTPSRVRVAERIGFALYVFLAVFLVGRPFIADRVVGAGTPAPSPTIATTALPRLPSTVGTTSPATPSVVASTMPTLTPQPRPDPLVVTAYQNGGRHFAALTLPVGYALTSPIAGTVNVVVYQFLGGEVRIGSNIPTEPFFPYVIITSAESKVTLRPGALDRDVQLLVRDGQAVAVGSPLFRTASDGASSWRTFYDRGVTAQVIVSIAARPSGAELDPIALFRR